MRYLVSILSVLLCVCLTTAVPVHPGGEASQARAPKRSFLSSLLPIRLGKKIKVEHYQEPALVVQAPHNYHATTYQQITKLKKDGKGNSKLKLTQQYTTVVPKNYKKYGIHPVDHLEHNVEAHIATKKEKLSTNAENHSQSHETYDNHTTCARTVKHSSIYRAVVRVWSKASMAPSITMLA
jgi:thiol:disulfide interchange protein